MIEQFTRMARIAKALVDGCLANLDVQDHLARKEGIWTEESVRRSPTVRVEWEYAIVTGGIGESLAAAKNKNWGEFVGVMPLQPDDYVDYQRITYQFTDACPYQKRFMQRKRMREILGRKFGKWVTAAKRSTKREFLADVPAEAVREIRVKLKLDPSEFWRASKGTVMVQFPPRPAQLTLLDLKN